VTIFSQHDIDELGQGATLELKPGDRLTPLARDRVVELGITVRDREGEPRTDARAAPRVPEPPSGALYRRGLPLQASSRLSGSGRLQRVGIVGAGHVGAATASLLASSGLTDELLLVDVIPGLAAGTALDISHAAGLSGFTTEVIAGDAVEQLTNADVVVVTAGRPRQPGMSRSDLLEENEAIVAPIAESLGRVAAGTVLVVVSNPVDEMTELAYRASGLPASRVLGMAGVLDAARMRAAAAKKAGANPREVEVLALGSHGEEMVIPQTLARLHGRPLAEQIGLDSFEQLVDQTRGAGAEVVRLLGTGSAYFAPAASVHRMLVAIAEDSDELMGASARASGQYGIHEVFLGLPVRVGRAGVKEIVELELAATERKRLVTAAEAIRRRCGELHTPPRT
jgi:malate dehydrogenase